LIHFYKRKWGRPVVYQLTHCEISPQLAGAGNL